MFQRARKSVVAVMAIAGLFFSAAPAGAWVLGDPLPVDYFPDPDYLQSPAPAACDGGGAYEKTVLIYAWVASDRSATQSSGIRAELPKIDAAFEKESSPRWGQKVDWHRDGTGTIVMCKAQLTDSNADGMLTSGEYLPQMRAQGLDVDFRKYLVFVDTTLGVCDNHGGDGCATAHHALARWPENFDIALHEFIHILGCCKSGAASDPHVSEFYDAMGERYGGRGDGMRNCELRRYTSTDRVPAVIDCMKNEYYSAEAAMGSNPDWIGTYGNIALSPYLTALVPTNDSGGVNCAGAPGVPYGREYGQTVTASGYYNAVEGNDTVNGTDVFQYLCGGDGSDTVRGYGGIDYVSGGAGPDTLYGNADTDYIYDGWGVDTIDGGAGTDTLYQCKDGATENIVNVENVIAAADSYCHHNYE